MTKVTLITAQPRAVANGAPTSVYLAGGGNAKPYYYGGQQYRAGITALTKFTASIEFDQDTGTGWTGVVVPTTGVISWAPSGGVLGSAKADLAAMAAYYWPNALISVSEGYEDTGVFTARLTGKVADAQIQNHQLAITIADLSVGLSQPLVTATFGGTGGIDGDAAATNRSKRRSWGRVFNVEGKVLNAANNIYEFGDPAFPLQSFDTVRDEGRDASPACTVQAWQGSIAATLTALEASTPVRGSGVVAPSIACVKWWTQPVGPLTADIRGEVGTGYVETCPEIAAAMLAELGGPTITNVAAAKVLRPGVAGIHVDQGENINAALNRLLFGVSLYWNLSPATGTITLSEFTFSGPVDSITSDNAQRTKTLQPVATRRVGYQQAYRVHSDGEIASSLLILGLQASAGAFTYIDGVATPSAQTITFTATGLDSGEAVNFMTSPIVPLTGTGLTRQLAIADFGANTQVTITATGVTSGASNSVNVVRQNTSTAAAGATVGATVGSNIYPPGGGVVPVPATDLQNSQIGVNTSGQLTNVSAAAGAVTVDNTKIGVNVSGQLTGIGTGNNTTVANSQISLGQTGTSYALTGAGSSATISAGGLGVAAGASADLTLTQVNSAIAIAGNTILNTTTNASYNFCAVAQALSGPCFVECDIQAGANFTIIALDDDATNSAYTSQVVLIYYQPSTGSFKMFGNNAGTQLYSATLATNLAGKIALAYNGVSVSAFVGGTQICSVAAPAGLTGAIYPKWWAYNMGVTYTGLKAGYFTNAQWSAIGGTGRPADNATVGAILGTNTYDTNGSTVLGVSDLKNVSIGFSGGKLTGVGAAAAAVTIDNSLVTLGNSGSWNNGAGGSGQISALDFVNVAGPTKPANNATSDATLTTFGGAVATGNTLSQSIANANFSYGAYAQAVYGPCFVECDISNAAAVFTIVGLDDDNTNSAYTAQVALLYYQSSTGLLRLYGNNNGTQLYGATIATGLTGKLTLVYDGVTLRGLIGGAQVCSVAAPAGLTSAIYPKWWAYNTGVTYTGFRCGYFNNALWSAIGGTGKPADNATVGGTIGPGGNITGAVDGNGRAIVDFSQAGHLNKSLANVDATASTKLGTIATNATVGAVLGTNTYDTNGSTILGVADLKNTAITIAGGAISGIGSGAGTVVANSAITVASGVLTGIGTAGVTVDNSTIAITGGKLVRYSGDTGLTTIIDNSLVAATYDTAGTGGRARLQLTSNGAAIGGAVTLPDATQNVAINITAGALQGIGSGAGTVVANSSITANADGTFSGGPTGQVTYDGIGGASTYAKVAATEVAGGGALKLSTAGSGKQIGDQRNLVPVNVATPGSLFTGAISASATPTSATISVAAGFLRLGTQAISYNAMSQTVSGSPGTTQTFYLYVDDPTFAGGTQTLQSSGIGQTVFFNDGRIQIGVISVTFPSSGTQSSTGVRGGGGGLQGTTYAYQ